MSSLALPVVPAPGSVGSSPRRALAVRAVSRADIVDLPDDVEHVAADVGTIEGARRACDGAAVVYHCVQPDYTKWAGSSRPSMQAVIEGATVAARAKLVFVDNLYLYGPPDGPMTEEYNPARRGPQGPLSASRCPTQSCVPTPMADCERRSDVHRITTARAAPTRPQATTS